LQVPFKVPTIYGSRQILFCTILENFERKNPWNFERKNPWNFERKNPWNFERKNG